MSVDKRRKTEKEEYGSHESLVLREGCGYEAILSSKGEVLWNFSAVGVRRIEKELMLRIFQGTDSFRNLAKNRTFGLTLFPPTSPAAFFPASLLGWGEPKTQEFKEEALDYWKNIPFVREGIHFLVCSPLSGNQTCHQDEFGETQVLEIRARVDAWRWSPKSRNLEPLSRGPALLVEALVHASKLEAALIHHPGHNEPRYQMPARQHGKFIFHLNVLEHSLATLERLGWTEQFPGECAALEEKLQKWQKIIEQSDPGTNGN